MKDLKQFIARGQELWGKLVAYNELELMFRCALDELEKMAEVVDAELQYQKTRNYSDYINLQQALKKLEVDDET